MAEIEGQFRSIARRAERTLAEAAARFGLDWSFSLKRQTYFETGLGGTEADLLVLQAQARPFAGQFRLPSRWAKLLSARHPVLLLHGERPAGGSVVLLLDPTTPAAPKSLAAATEMAALNRRPLIVLTKELADPAEIRRAVAAVSEAVAAQCRVEHVADPYAVEVRKLGDLGAGLLVVDASADAATAALRGLIAHIPADVLLVR